MTSPKKTDQNMAPTSVPFSTMSGAELQTRTSHPHQLHLDGIGRCRVGNERLQEVISTLEDLEAIVDVILRSSAVTDQGLAPLAQLPKLKFVNLANCQIDGSGLDCFAEHPALESLQLAGTCLNDEGLMKLADAPELNSVVVFDTKVTPEGVEAFQTARPDVEVKVYFG